MNALVLSVAPFQSDPRHLYWAEALRNHGYTVTQLELLDHLQDHRVASIAYEQDGTLTAASNRQASPDFGVLQELSLSTTTATGRFLLARVKRLAAAGNMIKKYLGDFDLVIANDLLGALIASEIYGDKSNRVIYDAQEVFTDAYALVKGPKLSRREISAWIQLETVVCQNVAEVVTVSDGIAELYAERHNITCVVAPNFTPLSKKRQSSATGLPIKFVLVGRVDPHRGIDKLVTAWDFPAEKFQLDLYLTDSPQLERLKKLSKSLHREFEGPNFRRAVKPGEIIPMLTRYDVGVVPYDFNYPYYHASPNKVGEYIAAGLPILTNDQAFVSDLVQRFGIGKVFSWDQVGSFNAAVCQLNEPSTVDQLKANVARVGSDELNWGKVTDALLRRNTRMINDRPQSGNQFFATEIVRATFIESVRAKLRSQLLRSFGKIQSQSWNWRLVGKKPRAAMRPIRDTK